MVSGMRSILLCVAFATGILLSGCASQDEADMAHLGPTVQQQRQDAKQKEEFARTLPPPRE